MNKIFIQTSLATCMILMSGCSTFVNPERAGNTQAFVKQTKDGFEGKIQSDKNAGLTELDVTTPDGLKIKFHSEDVDGSTAKSIDSETMKTLAETLRDTIK